MFFQPSSLNFVFLVVCLSTTARRQVRGHGLMEDPPSRNQFCGVLTKPHEVVYGNGGLHPECLPSFLNDFEGGYQFMSVLTHDIGRVGGRTRHVCGFDSETWQGGMTPWDTPMDWPTTTIDNSQDRLTITWNIAWGPHFDDTEEFRYWITNEDFVFDPTQELSWNDFAEHPFCVLTYQDSAPTANPDVTSNKQTTRFTTTCDVPPRSGRHVVYGEWGRNLWTYERFHGCLDLVFEGQGSVPVTTPSPVDPVTPSPVSPATPSPVDPMTTASPVDAVTPSPITPPTPSPVTPVTPAPVPVSSGGICNVILQGRNDWYAGLRIGFDTPTALLDFTNTGLDLNMLYVETNNFGYTIQGTTILLTKQDWISSSNGGHLNLKPVGGIGIPALSTFAMPTCVTGGTTRRNLRSA